ncbi:hypothetical protein Poly21_05390 [Allorhodopirellula heiligendammensis]|uniref:Uncharacterized protein n=1 Tax=Allorhodopirellula heiligendammensis TaxID=2714739 RepID=A0A5C6C2Z5_9BACT|nr:hypothetical protein Poly21_05390 [Allorhodopirellula heiligendammensis]
MTTMRLNPPYWTFPAGWLRPTFERASFPQVAADRVMPPPPPSHVEATSCTGSHEASQRRPQTIGESPPDTSADQVMFVLMRGALHVLD